MKILTFYCIQLGSYLQFMNNSCTVYALSCMKEIQYDAFSQVKKNAFSVDKPCLKMLTTLFLTGSDDVTVYRTY